jgi:hypothetical protein
VCARGENLIARRTGVLFISRVVIQQVYYAGVYKMLLYVPCAARDKCVYGLYFVIRLLYRHSCGGSSFAKMVDCDWNGSFFKTRTRRQKGRNFIWRSACLIFISWFDTFKSIFGYLLDAFTVFSRVYANRSWVFRKDLFVTLTRNDLRGKGSNIVFTTAVN